MKIKELSKKNKGIYIAIFIFILFFISAITPKKLKNLIANKINQKIAYFIDKKLSNEQIEKTIKLKTESFLNSNEILFNEKIFYISPIKNSKVFNQIIFLKILEKYNISTPKIEIVDLVINKQKKGLYLLKEKFETPVFLTEEKSIVFKISSLICNFENKKNPNYILSDFHQKEKETTFNKIYQEISNPFFLNSILDELNQKLKSTFYSLIKEYENNYILVKNKYYTSIKRPLRTHKILNMTHCFGFIDSIDDHSITFSFKNSTPLPIEIIAISLNGKVIHQFKEPIQFYNQGELSLEIQSKTIDLQEAIPLEEHANLVAVSRFIGLNQIKEDTIYPWPSFKKENLEAVFMLREPNIEKAPYLNIDHKSQTVTFKEGNWRLEDDLIIPKGYTVIAKAGLSLDLVKNSVILSYSPLKFKGTKENPIRIFSSDKTGQGLAVLNTKHESFLSYVFFDGLKNPNKKGWTLTSAVTFYESPAQFDYCRFENNECEDSLNMFRSDFIIDHSVFSNTLSDAFDADFSNGIIKNSQFIDCGNDGIDISGSFIQMEKVLLQGVGDKALSSGENSQMEGKNIEVVNAELGIASKDLSSIRLNNISLKDCTVGFTIFQKKPEFGAASVIVENFKEEGVKIPYLLEKKSTLTINEEEIQPNKKNVSDILYGNEYGKSSKR